ncbi:unnamed protein product [Symbiodinium sp. CCMP2592]|nr:unnamed protein product [Symbiodinium sp. CCMP2592]
MASKDESRSDAAVPVAMRGLTQKQRRRFFHRRGGEDNTTEPSSKRALEKTPEEAAEAHFRALRRRCGVPDTGVPRFFAPVFPCNSDAKKRWSYRASTLQAAYAERVEWTPTEKQLLQRALHAELQEAALQEAIEGLEDCKPAARQKRLVQLAQQVQQKRLRELLAERGQRIDWLNVSNKLRAMPEMASALIAALVASPTKSSPDGTEQICLSAANCYIRHLHDAQRSSDPVTAAEDAKLEAAARKSGALHLDESRSQNAWASSLPGLGVSLPTICTRWHGREPSQFGLPWMTSGCCRPMQTWVTWTATGSDPAHHSRPVYKTCGMGKRGGGWKPEWQPEWKPERRPEWQDDPRAKWGIWHGAKSPSQWPWRAAQEPQFPAFDAATVDIKEDGRDIARKELQATDGDDGVTEIFHDLQAMLNHARKAEVRMGKACKSREQTRAQWEAFDAKLKAAWVREKKRYNTAMARHEKEVTAAKEAQAAARSLVRKAYCPASDARPTPMEEEDSEWEKMKAAWDAEQSRELGGVLTRALSEREEGPPITPLRPTHAEARTPGGGGAEPSPARTDAYMLGSGGTPVASPAPAGTGLPSRLTEQSPTEPLRRDRPRTPRTAPYTGAKDGAVGPEDDPQGLAEKLEEAKRKAMLPFGGAGRQAEPKHKASRLVEDDPDELDGAATNRWVANRTSAPNTRIGGSGTRATAMMHMGPLLFWAFLCSCAACTSCFLRFLQYRLVAVLQLQPGPCAAVFWRRLLVVLGVTLCIGQCWTRVPTLPEIEQHALNLLLGIPFWLLCSLVSMLLAQVVSLCPILRFLKGARGCQHACACALGACAGHVRYRTVYAPSAAKHRGLSRGPHLYSQGTALSCLNKCIYKTTFYMLSALAMPTQVWAVSPMWGEAVDVLITATLMLPEDFPPPTHPGNLCTDALSHTGDIDSLDAEVLRADREQVRCLTAPLQENADLPAPPYNAGEGIPLADPPVDAVFQVLAPHFRTEVTRATLRFPCQYSTMISAVHDSVRELQSEFGQFAHPTMPQLAPDHGSFILAPSWVPTSGFVVVVYDFAACGGPTYAAYSHDRITHGDCRREAHRHSVENWHAYPFGHTSALGTDDSVLAVMGGVVQFRLTDEQPIWFSPVTSRLNRPNMWLPQPQLPEVPADRPVMVLFHDQHLLFSGRRFPGVSTRDFIADLVERRPETSICSVPTGDAFTDLAVHGVQCRGILATFPLCPTPDRHGIVIFLDPRRVNALPMHIYLPDRRVDPQHLINYLHIRNPPAYRIAVRPRPGLGGTMTGQHMKILNPSQTQNLMDPVRILTTAMTCKALKADLGCVEMGSAAADRAHTRGAPAMPSYCDLGLDPMLFAGLCTSPAPAAWPYGQADDLDGYFVVLAPGYRFAHFDQMQQDNAFRICALPNHNRLAPLPRCFAYLTGHVRDVLTAIGAGRGAALQIYFSTGNEPLHYGQVVPLMSGDVLRVSHYRAEGPYGTTFAEMLSSPLGWDVAVDLPFSFGPHVWLLADEHNTRFDIRDGNLSVRWAMASVLVASELLQRRHLPTVGPFVLVLDQRPVLMPIERRILPHPHVLVQELADEYGGDIPLGLSVAFAGADTADTPDGAAFIIEQCTCITVAYVFINRMHPDDAAYSSSSHDDRTDSLTGGETGSSESSDDDTPPPDNRAHEAQPAPAGPPDPHPRTHAVRQDVRSCDSIWNLWITGSRVETCAEHSPQQAFLLGKCSHTSVLLLVLILLYGSAGWYSLTNSRGSPPPLIQESQHYYADTSLYTGAKACALGVLCCRLRRLPASGACLIFCWLCFVCTPVAGMQLPSHGMLPSCHTDHSANPANSHGATRPNLIPTPCRSLHALPVLSSPDSDIADTCDAVFFEAGSPSNPGQRPDALPFPSHQDTLLEVAASSPGCAAFAIAVAVLEVLQQHFSAPSHHSARDPPRALELSTLVAHAPATGDTSIATSPFFMHAAETLSSAPDALSDTGVFQVPDQPPNRDQIHFGRTPLGFTRQQLHQLRSLQADLLPWERLTQLPALREAQLLQCQVSSVMQQLQQDGWQGALCFTDGSFTPASEHRAAFAGWACIFVDAAYGVLGAGFGSVPPWILGPQEALSAYVAECFALTIAAFSAWALFPGIDTTFASDCISALHGAEGRFACKPGGCAQAMSHAFDLRRGMHPTADRFVYVPGHQGHFFNEIADLLAKEGALSKTVAPCLQIPPEALRFWLSRGAYHLPWATVALRQAACDPALPPINALNLGDDSWHQGLSYDQMLRPFLPAHITSPDSSEGRHQQFDLALCILSFNTLSLGACLEDNQGCGSGERGLHQRPARAALLAQQLSDSRVSVAALQETRCPQGTSKIGGFLRFSGGADKGQHGTELWFKDGFRVLSAHDDGTNHVVFEEQCFNVCHADPRRIFVRFSSGKLALAFGSLHAPHRATERQLLTNWWHDTLKLVAKFRRNDPLILAGDLNCSVGSVPSDLISGACPEEEDLAGSLFHELLRESRCWLPCTFAECQEGPGATYHQKRNGKPCRPDLIAIPQIGKRGGARHGSTRASTSLPLSLTTLRQL